MDIEKRVKILETTVHQLSKDNLQLAFELEKMALNLAEVRSGVEYYSVVQEAVCEAFGVTASQVAGEFPDAWLKRTPSGLDSLLFGKNGQEFLSNQVCQARVVLCCIHRYVFRDKRRTHGELELTYPWYSRRQEYSLRKMFDRILRKEGPYANLHPKFEKARDLIQEKISE